MKFPFSKLHLCGGLIDGGFYVLMERLVRTLQLMFFAVFPPDTPSTTNPATSQVVASCQPREVCSLHRYLDSRGHFKVVFPNCLPFAGPFVLFRLKRQGYSSCTVQIVAEGLLVEGDR